LHSNLEEIMELGNMFHDVERKGMQVLLSSGTWFMAHLATK
jgi:hypothetical protein